MTDPYKVLGVSPNATDIEVKNAYRALARKYHPDNYDSSNPLAELASEKMKEVNEAYETIMQSRRTASGRRGGASGGATATYAEIRQMINARRIRDAEMALSRIPAAERVADWHYLESLVLMQRGFVNDAMRELEIACQMEPDNQEYQKAKEMFNQASAGYGRNYYGDTIYRQGGCSTCDMCQGLICADCCCECMGGDLISCC